MQSISVAEERRLPRAGLACIDILAPTDGPRHLPNLDAGPIRVDGLPGLRIALARTPVAVEVEAGLSTGGTVSARIPLPDVCSALALKASAYADRHAPKDASDIQRLLETAHSDGLTVVDWPIGPTFARASERLRVSFDRPGRSLSQLAPTAAGQARAQALLRRLIGVDGGR